MDCYTPTHVIAINCQSAEHAELYHVASCMQHYNKSFIALPVTKIPLNCCVLCSTVTSPKTTIVLLQRTDFNKRGNVSYFSNKQQFLIIGKLTGFWFICLSQVSVFKSLWRFKNMFQKQWWGEKLMSQPVWSACKTDREESFLLQSRISRLTPQEKKTKQLTCCKAFVQALKYIYRDGFEA